jgi:hypothetical protein
MSSFRARALFFAEREAVRVFGIAISPVPHDACHLIADGHVPPGRSKRIYIQFVAPLLQPIFDFSALFFLVDMPDVVRLIGKNEICHCAGSFDGQCLSGQLSSPPTEGGVHPPDIDWFGPRRWISGSGVKFSSVGIWYALDARNNQPRIGRIVVARGAADVAISTAFGPAHLARFKVITEELPENPEMCGQMQLRAI